ncbi:hypothetical protein JXJ21_03910 [candidate division KSB1 bacterium]|nr:hypothetical protein [candidate division KSB1 bacterium]
MQTGSYDKQAVARHSTGQKPAMSTPRWQRQIEYIAKIIKQFQIVNIKMALNSLIL